MRTVLVLLVFSLVLGPSVHALAESEPAFLIVVHPQNPHDGVSRAFLADAFLKKRTDWKDGHRIAPVDQAPDAPVRRHFSKRVLKRSVAAVRAYWQRIIFSGRGVPPPELADETAVLTHVRKHRGAVGYISGSTEPRGVKVISIR